MAEQPEEGKVVPLFGRPSDALADYEPPEKGEETAATAMFARYQGTLGDSGDES